MRLRAAVVTCVLLCQNIGLLFVPMAAHADGGTPLISELQVAGSSSASDEFVEFYNPTSSPIELKGWKFEYRSATAAGDCAAGWSTKATIAAGSIPAHGFYLLAPTGYLAGADAHFASGLASAGAVRLVDSSGMVADALAWGAGACGSGSPAPVPAAGHSLERRPGTDLETAGNAYDTGDNAADFLIRTTPAPQSTASPAEQPLESYVPPVAPEPSEAAALELNELLPDPAAPLTDAADEFVEIYNPNSFPVDVAGYILKTGTSLATKHSLAGGTVPAEGYLALKSGTTKIALSNTGSSVALFDPSGHQLGATVTYPKAKTGDSWARADDIWVWSAIPTPGEPNVIAEPAATSPSAIKASGSTKTSAATKAKAAAAAKAAKSAKATKAKVASTKSAASALRAATSPGGHWLLFALAGLTIAYVIYEFRYDIRNFYYKLRGYPGNSQAVSRTTPGRGSDRAQERLGRGQNHLRSGIGPWAWLRRRGSQPDVHLGPRV